MPNTMAYSKALIFVITTLISTRIASSFPAKCKLELSPAAADYDQMDSVPYEQAHDQELFCEPELNPAAADYDRMDRVPYEQAYDPELLSALPCKVAHCPPKK